MVYDLFENISKVNMIMKLDVWIGWIYLGVVDIVGNLPYFNHFDWVVKNHKFSFQIKRNEFKLDEIMVKYAQNMCRNPLLTHSFHIKSHYKCLMYIVATDEIIPWIKPNY